MLMFQFYSASIVVSLIAEPPRFINTPCELADSNLDFGYEDVGYMHDIFRVSVVHEIYIFLLFSILKSICDFFILFMKVERKLPNLKIFFKSLIFLDITGSESKMFI